LAFLAGDLAYGVRLAIAGVFFAIGACLVFFSTFVVPGLVLVLLGHLPLWVRRQSLAPGGATPKHEEVWVPVEEGWYDRIASQERKAAKWDATPWDMTNALGCSVLFGVIILIAILSILFSQVSVATGVRLLVFSGCLFLPAWLSGRRSLWSPSELRIKGRALEQAKTALAAAATRDFELVPMLALREGKRGRYPVDARLMARPADTGDSEIIGIQIQVALNNVRGRDYPYLYCVVLAQPGYDFPRIAEGRPWVYEYEDKDDVSYVVVRQYADNSGGWHTTPVIISELVGRAVALGERCLPPPRAA
jgi:hypothetical protein